MLIKMGMLKNGCCGMLAGGWFQKVYIFLKIYVQILGQQKNYKYIC
jgi:hypothetical protein